MACNGYYAQQNINVCINRDLVESFADSDIRKGLFLTESTFLPVRLLKSPEIPAAGRN